MTGLSYNDELFADLTEALGMTCSVVCAAVIVEDGNPPRHLIGDPEAAQVLPAQSLSPRWFLDRVTPVLDDDNNLLEWIAASQEITQLKRA